jgi:hypothetical protein
MTFRNRMEYALAHEEAVAQRLIDRGYQVGRFGQGMLTENVRAILRSHHTPLRWMPDIIAATEGEVLLVDAKAGRTDTPCHAIEKASLEALMKLQFGISVPVILVWSDFRCSPVQMLAHHELKRDGYRSPNGSGTPYWLIPKDGVTFEFDETFTGNTTVSPELRIGVAPEAGTGQAPVPATFANKGENR